MGGGENRNKSRVFGMAVILSWLYPGCKTIAFRRKCESNGVWGTMEAECLMEKRDGENYAALRASVLVYLQTTVFRSAKKKEWKEVERVSH